MKGKILVAVLNWGVGHASRCIPVMSALKKHGFTPIIASDGASLQLLQQEFPNEIFETLPDYNIQYSKEGKDFRFKIFSQLPKLFFAIKKERKMVKEIVKKHQIIGIISDNRPGMYYKNLPTVYITHQINVLSGNTSFISSKFHQFFIKKFDFCWVPDMPEVPNLSGKMSHENYPIKNTKFIGPISRMEYKQTTKDIDLLVVLSGPEPQRSLLEEKLVTELQNYLGKKVLVKGILAEKPKIWEESSFTMYNYATKDILNDLLLRSHLVIGRSGYSSIMDYAKLQCTAFLIPTPGQFEQEYLAKKLKREGSVASCTQHKFTADKLNKVTLYSGFRSYKFEQDWATLFGCFERKGKG
jgi:uncharacterized protein (TIGR00661 family)